MTLSRRQLAEYRRQGCTRVPLACEVFGDLDTPLSAYLKVAAGPYSYLFESVQGGERWGRYSIIGLPAARRIEARGGQVRVHDAEGGVVEEAHTASPLGWLRDYAARFRVPRVAGGPRFTGGLVGYFGYDLVRTLEPRLGAGPAADPLGSPDLLLMHSDELLVFDNLSGRIHVVVHVDPDAPGALAQGERRLADIADRLSAPLAAAPGSGRARAVEESDFTSGFTREGFERAVERVKRYIVDGDCMQVVLSQRLSVPYHAAPIDLYRALRSLNPSPYLYFLDLGGQQVAGSSPEILVRVEDGEMTVRPIAGTRPRGATEAQDARLAEELLADPKERAEHVMLIDLGRNDVGRVCETGSVRVTEHMNIERYSHVMHIVSNVTGRLRAGHDALDALAAAFPAGTVSGAPKVRAMEIIDELEPVRRGIYAGAIGYLSWHGNMDTAIAIRTAVMTPGELHIQAGAGIVADSVPEREWEETMNKGRAIFRAVSMSERGLARPSAARVA